MKFQPPASVEFKAPPLILVVDPFPRMPSSLVGVVIPPTNAFGRSPMAFLAAPRRRKVMVLREMAIEGVFRAWAAAVANKSILYGSERTRRVALANRFSETCL
jgi:hypothetical protein